MFRRSALVALMLMLLSTTSASAATATVKIFNTGFKPKVQTVTLGNSVKWKNASAKTHTATPTVSWSWGSVTVAAGTTSNAVSPTQAGTFPYFCSMHPKKKGTIQVRMTVNPLAGNTGTYFTLTLGTVTTPGVLVHQVEVSKNGGPWQLRVTTAQPTVSIFFPTTGTWAIRTRLRYQLGGATSEWSPVATVQVF